MGRAEPRGHRRVAAPLAVLTFLFAARVAGQAWVALADDSAIASVLPMEAWHSGLVPYPVLLPIQLLILGAQAWHIQSRWRRPGPHRPWLGSWLLAAAALYAAVMLARYGFAMAWRGGFGDPWWAGGLVPVLFHQVLALYLAVWGASLRWPSITGSEGARDLPGSGH